jgi:hypothetical protein
MLARTQLQPSFLHDLFVLAARPATQLDGLLQFVLEKALYCARPQMALFFSPHAKPQSRQVLSLRVLASWREPVSLYPLPV